MQTQHKIPLRLQLTQNFGTTKFETELSQEEVETYATHCNEQLFELIGDSLKRDIDGKEIVAAIIAHYALDAGNASFVLGDN